jgi:hypothetical protein
MIINALDFKTVQQLDNLFNLLIPAVVEVLKDFIPAKDFKNNTDRLSRCHLVYGTETTRIGISYAPAGFEISKNYHVIANTVYNNLIECPDTEDADVLFTSFNKREYAGGVTRDGNICCIAGYHPQVARALSVIFLWRIFKPNSNLEKITKDFSELKEYVDKIVDIAGGEESLITS